MTQFTDRASFDGALRKTDDGWVAQARVARGGNVQVYLGSEMGFADRQIVRVYRPETEVFDRKAFATYARKPITMGHPSGGVTPDTWKDLAVGEIDRDVVRDGEFVSVPLLFRDAKAVDEMQASDGPRELSMGYDANVELKDGISPAGEHYDAVMSDFNMNHVAVVPVARGGSELRIGDGAVKWGASPVHDAATKEPQMADLRKIMVDGLSVETTDAGAQAIEKLTKKIADDAAAATKAATDAKMAHDKEISDKDTIIGELRGDLKKAQDAAIKPADLDKLVKDRAALVAVVSTLDATIVVDGKSDADLRKAAVAAKMGDEMVKDASEAEINGMFKAITKDVQADDPVRKALKDSKPADDLTKVYATRDADLQNAWKTPAAKEA